MLAVTILTSTIELPATVVYAADVDNVKTELDISKGTIEFGYSNNERTVEYGGELQPYDEDGYIITGMTSTYKIKVNAGTHDITLSYVEITLDGSDGPQPVFIENGAGVNLELVGENKLVAGDYCAGLQVRPEASVTIEGEGSLEVIGGEYSAGIGGGNACPGGKIVINSGTVTSTGGAFGAGIGGGNDYNGDDYGSNTVGPIIINGGTVTAKGGVRSAGIGGGNGGPGGTVIITGGNVDASGDFNYFTEHIGHGDGSSESGTIKNGSGDSAENLTQFNISFKGLKKEGAIIVEGLEEDYLKGAKLIDERLCLWLPADTKIGSITIGDIRFEGEIDDLTKRGCFTPASNLIDSPTISLTDDLALFELNNVKYYNMGEQCQKYSGTLSVNGTTNKTFVIKVESGSHDIVLNNVNIDVSTISYKRAFYIENKASVNLKLKGENSLKSGESAAGIYVPGEAELTISGSGKLEVSGGTYAAGIGGEIRNSTGVITINEGTITAYAGKNACAIGSGKDGNGGTITINGGTIVAEKFYRYDSCDGIGWAYSGAVGTVVITGGNIYTLTISGTPKNGTGPDAEQVFRHTFIFSNLESNSPVSSITGIGEYNLKGVTTLDKNKLYAYSPKKAGDMTHIEATIYDIVYSTAEDEMFNSSDILLHSDFSYEFVDDVRLTGIKGKNGWYRSDITITAPEGYYIGKTPSSAVGSKMIITEDMDEDIPYYLKEIQTGEISGEKIIHIKRDVTAPNTEIVIGDKSFRANCDTITYNLFYKDKAEILIKNNESIGQSKIESIEYQIVKKGNVYNVNNGWSEGEKALVQDAKGFVIYVRVTDEAGNVTAINSDGIVVYKDSVLDQESITYTCGTGKDASVGVTLNENTLKSIQLGERVLVKDKDYVLQGRTIIFKNSYLETLAGGTYKLDFYYNPLGQEISSIAMHNSLNLVIRKQVISEVSLDIATPIAGMTAPKSISEKEYTGTILWNCTGETFDFNKAHTAMITLIPNEQYEFDKEINVPEYTVNYNADGSLTFSKKFEATRKAVLTSLTAPGIQKFSDYNETPDEALACLNSSANTVTVTTEDGVTALPITWSFEGNYISTPGATNAFMWKLDTDNYKLNTGIITEGTVQIENTNVEGVTVTPKDTEIVYDGESYDVSELFEISEHTGKEVYTVENQTGEGVLEDSDLTITKAGTFKVMLSIEAAGKYNATSASAVLTVKKGEGEADIEIEGWIYGENGKNPVIRSENYDVSKATVIFSSTDGKGYNSSVMPVAAGEYLATVTLQENNLYVSNQIDAEFVIEPRDIEGAVITLGKRLVYTGTEQVQQVASVMLDGMVLGAEDYIVTDNKVIDADMDYTLTVIGQGNFTGSETMDFSVEKMDAPLIPDINKSYQYTVGSQGKVITIDIAKLLPADRGETVYTVTASTREYLIDPFVEEDGKLTYEVDAAYAKDSTSLVVTAISQKYKDMSIKINIVLTAGAVPDDEDGVVKVGATIKDAKKQAIYKVTKIGNAERTVEYVKPVKKSVSRVTIPETIKVDGITYKVTGIAKNAFRNYKKLKQVTIGKQVKAIGAHAFYNCKKLKSITIKTTNLTKKTVGAKAFKGIYVEADIRTPKGKQKPYEKLLKAKGVGSQAKFK